MAYLKKEQYEYRSKAAAQRNARNEATAIANGMTEEQADTISRLCSLRHELHTNMDKVTNSDSDIRIKYRLVQLAREMHELGLEPIEGIPYGECDYIDIDDIDDLYEIEDWPESCTQEWQDMYDEEYSRIYEELEGLNKNIENWLAQIDKKYGTTFAPTGALRIM